MNIENYDAYHIRMAHETESLATCAGFFPMQWGPKTKTTKKATKVFENKLVLCSPDIF